MSAIRSRSLNIALNAFGATVSLTWFNHFDNGGCESKWVTVDGFGLEDWNKVRVMVNTMGENAMVACLKDNRLSVFVDCKESMSGVFDTIAQSIDPKESILQWDKLLISTEELLGNG